MPPPQDSQVPPDAAEEERLSWLLLDGAAREKKQFEDVDEPGERWRHSLFTHMSSSAFTTNSACEQNSEAQSFPMTFL